MNTTENNKLIAEFMGCTLKSNGTVTPKGNKYTFPNNDNEERHPSMCRYHLSWDWLMPVMKKIEDINGKVFITTSLEANYNMVVEYIKWYNKNKED